VTGWIKVHRKIRESRCWADPIRLRAWLDLLLSATHKEQWVHRGNHDPVMVLPGQVLTSKVKLAERWGLARGTVISMLNKWELEQQIEQLNTNRYTLITIKNWNSYQADEQQIEQPLNSSRTAVEQPLNTFKKEEKEKNEKKGRKTTPKTAMRQGDKITEKMVEYAAERGWRSSDISTEYEKFKDHWLGKGETRKDWLATWRTWCRNAERFGSVDTTATTKPSSKPWEMQFHPAAGEAERRCHELIQHGKGSNSAFRAIFEEEGESYRPAHVDAAKAYEAHLGLESRVPF